MAELKITEPARFNFDQLVKAIKNGDAGLIVCFDDLTGREEIAIAAFGRPDDCGSDIQIMPYALLTSVHEMVFDRLRAPKPEGGYFPINEEVSHG